MNLRHGAFGLVVALTLGTAATAGIPEPDNAVYGDIRFSDSPTPPALRGLRVEVHEVLADGSAGALLDSYVVGSNPQAAAYQYVVRVKVDTGSVERPGAILKGKKFAIYVAGTKVSSTMTAVGIGTVNSLFRNQPLVLDASMRASADEILRQISGRTLLDGVKRVTADVNQDGVIDEADYTARTLAF